MGEKYDWLIVLSAALALYLVGLLTSAHQALFGGMSLGLTGVGMALYLTSRA